MSTRHALEADVRIDEAMADRHPDFAFCARVNRRALDSLKRNGFMYRDGDGLHFAVDEVPPVVPDAERDAQIDAANERVADVDDEREEAA